MFSPVKQIVLLRHGVTDWNCQSRYQGRSDVSLNEDGRRQAAACRDVVQGWNPQLIFTSPLSRATETAVLASGRSVGDMTVCPELCEISFGKWETCTRDEIASSWADAYASWGEDPDSVTPPDGESFLSVRERAAGVLRRAAQSEEARILIVSHGGTLRALLAEALGAPSRATWRFCLNNCSLTGLEYWNGQFWLSFSNDCRHLSFCSRPTAMDAEGGLDSENERFDLFSRS